VCSSDLAREKVLVTEKLAKMEAAHANRAKKDQLGPPGAVDKIQVQLIQGLNLAACLARQVDDEDDEGEEEENQMESEGWLGDDGDGASAQGAASPHLAAVSQTPARAAAAQTGKKKTQRGILADIRSAARHLFGASKASAPPRHRTRKVAGAGVGVIAGAGVVAAVAVGLSVASGGGDDLREEVDAGEKDLQHDVDEDDEKEDDSGSDGSSMVSGAGFGAIGTLFKGTKAPLPPDAPEGATLGAHVSEGADDTHRVQQHDGLRTLKPAGDAAVGQQESTLAAIGQQEAAFRCSLAVYIEVKVGEEVATSRVVHSEGPLEQQFEGGEWNFEGEEFVLDCLAPHIQVSIFLQNEDAEIPLLPPAAETPAHVPRLTELAAEIELVDPQNSDDGVSVDRGGRDVELKQPMAGGKGPEGVGCARDGEQSGGVGPIESAKDKEEEDKVSVAKRKEEEDKAAENAAAETTAADVKVRKSYVLLLGSGIIRVSQLIPSRWVTPDVEFRGKLG
jgi:hypothetical protein